jgi:hypothetical protein
VADLRAGLLVFAAIAAGGVVLAARHMVRRHGFWVLVWRWLSGMPLDGQFRTDATWFRSSSVALHPLGRSDPSRVHSWHHRPRIQRAAVRTGVTVGPLLLLAAAAAWPVATAAVLAVPTAAACGYAVWRVYVLARRLRHHLAWHRPTYRALARELPAPPPRLAIEPDRSKVTIGLPEDFTGSDREREAITRVVTVKLALEAPDPDWQLTGRKPQVVFTRSEPPPELVPFSAIRAEVEQAAEHEIVIGLGKKKTLVKVSIDSDSPHIGLSMESGAGKSSVAKNIAAQILFHGGLVLVLDVKLISHNWFKGLPNVAYARTAAEIHCALLWLAGEIQRRNEVAEAGADVEGEVHANVGPRLLVVCEEMNATQNRLAAYWRKSGGKGRSPAAEALDEAQFIGRQVRAHCLIIGQRLSAKAAGSGDSRENLGTKLLYDPTSSTWKMLVGDRHALPPAAGHKGRIQVVTAKAVRETQGAWLTGAEARRIATAGTVAVPRSDMPFTGAVTPLAATQIPGPDQEMSHIGGLPVTPAQPGWVSLAEAAEGGLFPSLAAARRASHRPGFPAPVGKRGSARLYDVSDLHLHRQKENA